MVKDKNRSAYRDYEIVFLPMPRACGKLTIPLCTAVLDSSERDALPFHNTHLLADFHCCIDLRRRQASFSPMVQNDHG
ncbi:hypothetical protein SAMN05660284_02188 [Formivibrio citricus]|uniref:Uncharacterized protein n=1 Tax=Formivibrio citricus TaxID=83765 RepID=A0A1I5BKF6_9NEIS|nr:hypothetical protein SAMN05660284_02188 [Formivibrio citricus]